MGSDLDGNYIEMLSSEDAGIRLEAVRSLAVKKIPGSVELLASRFGAEDDTKVMLALIEALSELAPEEAAALCVPCLWDDKAAVRIAAVHVIAEHGDAQKQKALKSLLDDPVEQVSIAAEAALCRAGIFDLYERVFEHCSAAGSPGFSRGLSLLARVPPSMLEADRLDRLLAMALEERERSRILALKSLSGAALPAGGGEVESGDGTAVPFVLKAAACTAVVLAVLLSLHRFTASATDRGGRFISLPMGEAETAAAALCLLRRGDRPAADELAGRLVPDSSADKELRESFDALWKIAACPGEALSLAERGEWPCGRPALLAFRSAVESGSWSQAVAILSRHEGEAWFERAAFELLEAIERDKLKADGTRDGKGRGLTVAEDFLAGRGLACLLHDSASRPASLSTSAPGGKTAVR